ncbi:MAG: UDP-N-acetylglucosamine 1-carboxyvinyltransferase [bacterium]
MSRFIIHGRRRLSGIVRPAGNKNAVLPMLAASVLTDEPVTIDNVPQIRDVETMLAILDALGVTVAREERRVTLCARNLRRGQLDPALCRQVRASILFAGPLAARLGRATLPPPGGDIIGRRRLDTHVEGLAALGIEMQPAAGHYIFRRRHLRGAALTLDEASVTATENIMMAAVLAEGTTTLFNAACEPHVGDLAALLIAMGATIRGIGTNQLEIDGVPALHGATHTVLSDHVEAGSYLLAAAATGGELVLEGTPRQHMTRLVRPLQRLGIDCTVDPGGRLTLPARRTRRIVRDLNGAIPKIEDGPWPAFPSDLMSVAIVAATQFSGTALFFEKMFESRMYFVDSLINMGAGIVVCDPHRVLVSGPARLHGTKMATPDIRAGMALLVAALCARGTSVIENAESVDRGYERVEETLRSLGAEITREN